MTSPVWRKSSRSTQGTSGECVEVAQLPGAIGLRDSKNPVAGHQAVSREAFAGLVKKIKQRDLDL
jgi:Domain of unknown function (DUF397)